jgi:hypothetical protein
MALERRDARRNAGFRREAEDHRHERRLDEQSLLHRPRRGRNERCEKINLDVLPGSAAAHAQDAGRRREMVEILVLVLQHDDRPCSPPSNWRSRPARRVGNRVRRREHDDRSTRSSRAPLPHLRNRKRQLPLQEQLGESQTRKEEILELDERLSPKPSSSRVSSRWKSAGARHINWHCLSPGLV